MQPEHRGGGADQPEVAASDGPALHAGGPAGHLPAHLRAAADGGNAGEDTAEGGAGVKEGTESQMFMYIDL